MGLVIAVILAVSQPLFAAHFLYQTGSTDVNIVLTQPNEIIAIKALSNAYEFTLTNGSWQGTFTGATVSGSTLTFQKSALPSGTTIIRLDGMAFPGNQVHFLNSGANTYDSYLAVNLLNKPGAVTFDGETRFTGTTLFTINTYKNIVFNPGSYVSTESGLIYFKAGKDERDTANYSGIEVNGGTIHLQGLGSSVLLEGYAGTGTGDLGDMHGIHFRNGGKITGGSTS